MSSTWLYGFECWVVKSCQIHLIGAILKEYVKLYSFYIFLFIVDMVHYGTLYMPSTYFEK